MNYIDNEFYTLVKLIKNMTKDELYCNIKNNYQNLNEVTKLSISNFMNEFKFWGELHEGNYEEINNRTNLLSNHIDDLSWLYNKLEDYQSKKILYAVLSNWYNYDFKNLNEVMDKLFYNYFDLNLIPNAKDEVLVDLGTYTGDTVNDYIKTYGKNSYKKIYCFDLTDNTLAQAKHNLKEYNNIYFYKKAVSDEFKNLYLELNPHDSSNRVSETGSNEIESITLDEFIKEPITMLKMDIEGSEYKALIGSKNQIQNNSPKLFISIYHGYEDIWRIPKLISEYNDNYKFYLRYYGGPIFPTEITLIAIPK